MPNEGHMNNRTRVSPYPLRSTRSDNVPISPIETEGPKQWNDVQCSICMEPPHNAVLMHCSSYHIGCRSYICDTSARHSNCLKQLWKNHKSRRVRSKSPNCPLCRGQIYETVVVTAARRFMNAKPRTCTIEGCEFMGTYAQLNTHLKAEHTGFIPPKVDPTKQQMWEEMERESEYNEILTVAGLPPPPRHHEVVSLSQHSLTLELRIDAIVGNTFVSTNVGNRLGAGLRPGTQFRVRII